MSDLLRKVQLVEYDMLKEFDRIAKKHGIKYTLGCGTLLGAAKYKGFIPWDDDIDLLIDYKELNKFIEIFKKEAHSNYIITNCFIEKHFPLSWAKVRNSNTLSRPKRYKELPINWGICIDLFPVYPVSNFSVIRKVERFLYKTAKKILLAEFTKYEDNHGIIVRFLEKIPISLRHLYFKMVLEIFNLHGDNTKYVMSTSSEMGIFKREHLLGKTSELEFEGGVFPVPCDYESYLTFKFGDWKADLPDELKKGHDLTLGDIEWKI